MKRVAIVGHEGKKFTPETEAKAREIIRGLLVGADIVVSGGCHLGGVDIFAAEEGRAMGLVVREYLPERRSWEGGYKERNLAIAGDCDEAHCIVVAELPPTYKGMTFAGCYHCHKNRPPHVKSGGCWTVVRAERLGVPGFWHII